MTEEQFPDVSVMFRKWKTCEDIIALFPYVPHVDYSHQSEILVESYSQSEGDIDGSDFDFVMENTVPACEVIYRELKKDLEMSYGYLLEVIEEVDEKRMKSIYS